MTKYTLVQHSGFGYAGKDHFAHGVETRSVTELEEALVEKWGGVLFDGYSSAETAAENESYPPGVEGIIPQAIGHFAEGMIDGLRVYVPKRDDQ